MRQMYESVFLNNDNKNDNSVLLLFLFFPVARMPKVRRKREMTNDSWPHRLAEVARKVDLVEISISKVVVKYINFLAVKSKLWWLQKWKNSN